MVYEGGYEQGLQAVFGLDGSVRLMTQTHIYDCTHQELMRYITWKGWYLQILLPSQEEPLGLIPMAPLAFESAEGQNRMLPRAILFRDCSEEISFSTPPDGELINVDDLAGTGVDDWVLTLYGEEDPRVIPDECRDPVDPEAWVTTLPDHSEGDVLDGTYPPGGTVTPERVLTVSELPPYEATTSVTPVRKSGKILQRAGILSRYAPRRDSSGKELEGHVQRGVGTFRPNVDWEMERQFLAQKRKVYDSS